MSNHSDPSALCHELEPFIFLIWNSLTHAKRGCCLAHSCYYKILYTYRLLYVYKGHIWMTSYLDFISSRLHVTWGFETEGLLTVQDLKAFLQTSSFCLPVLTLLSTSPAMTLATFLGAGFARHQLKHRKNKHVSFTSRLFSSLVLGHVSVALLLICNSFSTWISRVVKLLGSCFLEALSQLITFSGLMQVFAFVAVTYSTPCYIQ